MNQGNLKNTLVGIAIGAVAVGGGYYLFSDKQSPTINTQNQQNISAKNTGKDYNCGDFSSKAEAQSFFEANGGPNLDPYQLDRDKDGRVCEILK